MRKRLSILAKRLRRTSHAIGKVPELEDGVVRKVAHAHRRGTEAQGDTYGCQCELIKQEEVQKQDDGEFERRAKEGARHEDDVNTECDQLIRPCKELDMKHGKQHHKLEDEHIE